MKECALKCLTSTSLAGSIPGLRWLGAEFDASTLACCAGSGMLTNDSGTLICNVRQRMLGLATLARRHQDAWMGERTIEAELLPSAAPDGALARLHALSRGSVERGISYIRKAGEPRSSSMWHIAFAAAWRFGFDVRVAVLGKSRRLAEVDLDGIDARRGALLIIENATKLWSENEADSFERLVAKAYGAMVPIFVEIVLEESVGARPVKASFSRKVSEARHKKLNETLRGDCWSKLASLTDGLETLKPHAGKARCAARDLLPHRSF